VETKLQSTAAVDSSEFRELLGRLSEKARVDYYNPYTKFDWPETIPADAWWMSPELLSMYGTEFMDELAPTRLHALSRWESINFYSLNVHGIRELLIEVTRRIHSPGFEIPSDFFHHFIGEENEHMWFFATFCRKYGSKVYPEKTFKFSAAQEPALENFLVFARILIFEQIVDYYNVYMATDGRLHPIIQHINRLHHQDESRHIAFGARLVQLLWNQLLDAGLDAERRRSTSDYLNRYITASIESFYNPSVYKDSAISGGFALRQRLLRHPARQQTHARVLRKTTDFFARIGVFEATA